MMSPIHFFFLCFITPDGLSYIFNELDNDYNNVDERRLASNEKYVECGVVRCVEVEEKPVLEWDNNILPARISNITCKKCYSIKSDTMHNQQKFPGENIVEAIPRFLKVNAESCYERLSSVTVNRGCNCKAMNMRSLDDK